MSKPIMIVLPSTSTMTSLNGKECHNLTMKRVGCGSHVAIREAATFEARTKVQITNLKCYLFIFLKYSLFNRSFVIETKAVRSASE